MLSRSVTTFGLAALRLVEFVVVVAVAAATTTRGGAFVVLLPQPSFDRTWGRHDHHRLGPNDRHANSKGSIASERRGTNKKTRVAGGWRSDRCGCWLSPSAFDDNGSSCLPPSSNLPSTSRRRRKHLHHHQQQHQEEMPVPFSSPAKGVFLPPPCGGGDGGGGGGQIRINKALGRTHSRRQADLLVEQGRVTVNGLRATAGMRIDPTLDKVCVDGTPVTVGNDKRAGQIGKDTSSDNDGEPSTSFHEHEYILYWKPVGITCTCDVRIPGNLVEALHRRSGNLVEARPDDGGGYEPAPRRRVFPVGRLDRDTSGLLLLTSDGDLPNAVLRGESSQPKTYLVTLDRPIRPEDVRDLEEGVVITTETSRRRRRRRSAAPPPKQDGGAISAYRRTLRTAPTRPARASVRPDRPNELFITIREGRNRQVRKMIKAVGYEVHKLHRTEFAGLTLEGLDGPGNWRRLTEDERVRVVRRVMSRAAGHHRGA